MKLIDLLVQELPKRGGWPEGVNRIHQDHNGEVYAWQDSSCKLQFRIGIIADNCRAYGKRESIDDMVTRDQYESALAASQKPAWNGEFPIPSGTDVDVHFDGDDSRVWTQFRVEYMKGEIVVLYDYRTDNVDAYKQRTLSFRPLRTESEKKRDAFINAVLDDVRTIPCDLSLRDEVAVIYDAIAAGKIPGVKLDD